MKSEERDARVVKFKYYKSRAECEKMAKVQIEIRDSEAVISGDTFSVRDVLKEYYFKWFQQDKAWKGSNFYVDYVIEKLKAKGVAVEVVDKRKEKDDYSDVLNWG